MFAKTKIALKLSISSKPNTLLGCLYNAVPNNTIMCVVIESIVEWCEFAPHGDLFLPLVHSCALFRVLNFEISKGFNQEVLFRPRLAAADQNNNQAIVCI
jgi:hypothetical protein